MWERGKGGLWVLTRKRNTADRPHRITIILGLLSPAAAVVALIFSYNALKISDRSLRVANRAYVSVAGGNVQFVNFGTVMRVEGSTMPNHFIVRMEIAATIQNAGNSPATPGEFTPQYDLPDGWSNAPDWVKKRITNRAIGVIPPKSMLNWKYTELFELAPAAYNAFLRFPGRTLVYMHAKFDYRDVFEKTTPVTWCWVAAGNVTTTAVTDCAQSLQLEFATP